MMTHPSGNLMLMESLYGLNVSQVDRLVITVVAEHIQNAQFNLNKMANDIQLRIGLYPEFYILEDFTSSQSETVYKTLVQKEISGSFFVKDCDNYFHTTIEKKNTICFSFLQEDINAVNKSYISLNKFGNVSGIIEKTVIGDRFCVGGYSFKDTEAFKHAYEVVSSFKHVTTKEIYLSHIIQQMILHQEEFEAQEVSNYCDWGTTKDWQKYTAQFRTIFIDLDGVLVENGSEYMQPTWGDSDGLSENIKTINQLFDSSKACIIITTSRKETYQETTMQQLERLGIKFHHIIFGLPHAQRILINDYSASNPFPSASAINLKRNHNNLNDYIK